ncbi:hypothetical protein niasHT_033872 [Heterodera trifolii]|uniref:Ubiquitin-like domain-containing protein n=1 Tax=Heterodera trifolii TaxID=157864 RepID=A0ABD2I809_9BILA
MNIPFGFSLFSVGISAGLTMLLLMMSHSSIADYHQSFTIFVKYANGSKKYNFSVNSRETVKSLKEKIKNWIGILPEHQILKFRRHLLDQLLDDNEQLASYGIKSLSNLSLSLKRKFDIVMKYNGTKYAVEVKGTEKVASLKTKIKEKIPALQPKNLSLSCNGKTLEVRQKVDDFYMECIGQGKTVTVETEEEQQQPLERKKNLAKKSGGSSFLQRVTSKKAVKVTAERW